MLRLCLGTSLPYFVVGMALLGFAALHTKNTEIPRDREIDLSIDVFKTRGIDSPVAPVCKIAHAGICALCLHFGPFEARP